MHEVVALRHQLSANELAVKSIGASDFLLFMIHSLGDVLVPSAATSLGAAAGQESETAERICQVAKDSQRPSLRQLRLFEFRSCLT